MNRAEADFRFDPMCPFANQASAWLRPVRAETGVRVGWRCSSLEEASRFAGQKVSGRDWVSANRGQVIDAGSSR